jgi:hypothetical protein
MLRPVFLRQEAFFESDDVASLLSVDILKPK